MTDTRNSSEPSTKAVIGGLVVVLLLVIGGCNALVSRFGGDAEDGETVTRDYAAEAEERRLAGNRGPNGEQHSDPDKHRNDDAAERFYLSMLSSADVDAGSDAHNREMGRRTCMNLLDGQSPQDAARDLMRVEGLNQDQALMVLRISPEVFCPTYEITEDNFYTGTPPA